VIGFQGCVEKLLRHLFRVSQILKPRNNWAQKPKRDMSAKQEAWIMRRSFSISFDSRYMLTEGRRVEKSMNIDQRGGCFCISTTMKGLKNDGAWLTERRLCTYHASRQQGNNPMTCMCPSRGDYESTISAESGRMTTSTTSLSHPPLL
jgi:hypothetical protein